MGRGVVRLRARREKANTRRAGEAREPQAQRALKRQGSTRTKSKTYPVAGSNRARTQSGNFGVFFLLICGKPRMRIINFRESARFFFFGALSAWCFERQKRGFAGLRARGGGLGRRPRARGAAVGDPRAEVARSVIVARPRHTVARARHARITSHRAIVHAPRHRLALVVVVARNAGVCVHAAIFFARRPRARGAAIGNRRLGSLVRSLWRALVTRHYIARARVTPASRIIAHILRHRPLLVVVVARRAGVCVRTAGVSTAVLAPATWRSVIGGRGRLIGHCRAPSSNGCARAAPSRHEPSRTRHVITRRSSLSSCRMQGGACARRGFSTVVLAPAARRSVIGGWGRSFGHCGAPSSCHCSRASRPRLE